MQTKLTVRVERRWLEQARRYSVEHGTTLSQLISEFLRGLPTADRPQGRTPIMDRLAGILPEDVDVEEHRRHSARKHRS